LGAAAATPPILKNNIGLPKYKDIKDRLLVNY
jgi:hypothetical protein